MHMLIIDIQTRKSCVYYMNTSGVGGLIVSGTLVTHDHIGDILPDETKTTQFTVSIDEVSNSDEKDIKVAWIDATKEFAI